MFVNTKIDTTTIEKLVPCIIVQVVEVKIDWHIGTDVCDAKWLVRSFFVVVVVIPPPWLGLPKENREQDDEEKREIRGVIEGRALIP